MKPGMTLYGLARSHHLTVQQLASANNIKPPYVVPLGRVLNIPAGSTATAAAKPAMMAPVAKPVAPAAPAMKAAAAPAAKPATPAK